MSFACVLHFIMSSCALHCIRVRLMHPSLFPVVHFAIRRSYVIRRPLLASLRVRVLNVFGLDLDLSCGLGLLPVDRLSSFVPFGLRLILQQLTEGPKSLVCVAAQHPSKVAQNPPKPPPSSRSFDHDHVAENRTSFGAS